jgi:hypothetical protein
MPILYVHGVNTRSREGFFAIEPLLRRHVAPEISKDPASVFIDDYYWGDRGVKLYWDGASRPRTQLLGKGFGRSPEGILTRSLVADENRKALEQYPPVATTAQDDGGLLSAPGGSKPVAAYNMPPLTDLTPEQLSDLLAGLIVPAPGDAEPVGDDEARANGAARARLLEAADDVARDPATQVALVGQTPERQVEILIQLVRDKANQADPLAGKGLNDWWNGLTERLGEALDRGEDRLGHAVSVVLAELRPKLNALVSNFIGDVFVYLHGRDDVKSYPGSIQNGLIEKLKLAHARKLKDENEPLVVLTHSMGGQLVWDAVTSVLAGDPATKDIRIDFWCACASQVGFFEEAKLFLASDLKHRTGFPVPFPHANLGAWWNVWDHNDVLSFTAKDICAGADDEAYSSGKSLASAHGGYLERASFFRGLGKKIRAAKKTGFQTT